MRVIHQTALCSASAAPTGPRGRNITTMGLNLPFMKSKEDVRLAKKSKLLESLDGLQRGANATKEDMDRVERLASDLERVNPTSAVLGPSLTGRWKLLYTTSGSILGTNRPQFLRPFGDIFQSIDAENLRARNQETLPFFNAVEAQLIPVNKRKVQVQFKTFFILGFIPIQAPPSASGELEVTYLDDDLRVSRGNRGNLFVLSRANGRF